MLAVVAAIVRRRGPEGGEQLLICQRARHRSHPLQWEFPGGKLEPGESEPQALARELFEELGIRAEAGRLRARVRHQYAGGAEVEVAFYELAAFTGEPENRDFAALAWVAPSALGSYDFLAADLAVLQTLAADSPAGC
ncbi:MAG: (deoxy)nucleoside triphosphate pyrophosphohydrolase [Terriglobales bacterium]